MAITMELSPEIERLSGEKVRSGEFPNADELVRQAVRRLIDDERAIAFTEALQEARRRS
jgi:Arc/MetJ-type ribon-helix-helix transcriptional regulator